MTYYYVVNGYLNLKHGGDPPSSTYVAESDGILTYVNNNEVVERVQLPQNRGWGSQVYGSSGLVGFKFARDRLKPSEPGIHSSSDGSPVASGPYGHAVRKRKRTKAKTKRKCKCK